MARWLILALAGALTLSVALSVAARDGSTTNVQVRVWQSMRDPLNIYISARHEDGRWEPIGTIPLPLDEENKRGTYRYGDITLPIILPESPPTGGDPKLTAVAPSPSLTLEDCRWVALPQDVSPGAPCLVVVSDGSLNGLTLEWVGGPDDPAKWQYRRRSWENFGPLPWEDWTGIPDGCAITRACRLTGLPEDALLDFQVRAVGGPASVIAGTRTPTRGNLPWVSRSQIAEGDGTTEWIVSEFAITIPDGVRLVSGGIFISACPSDTEDCISEGVQINHFLTASSLSFSRDGGNVFRYIDPLAGDQGDAVNAIFDQIVASIRLLTDE